MWTCFNCCKPTKEIKAECEVQLETSEVITPPNNKKPMRDAKTKFSFKNKNSNEPVHISNISTIQNSACSYLSPHMLQNLSSIGRNSEFPLESETPTFKDNFNLMSRDSNTSEIMNLVLSQSPKKQKLLKLEDLDGDLLWGQEVTIRGTKLFGLKADETKNYTSFSSQMTQFNKEQMFFIKYQPVTILSKNLICFLIHYEKDKDAFYLHRSIQTPEINFNLSLLLMPDKKFIVKDNYRFLLGSLIMTVNIVNDLSVHIINIAINNSSKSQNINNSDTSKFSFTESDCPIRIGRSGCEINLPDKKLSKFHCSISFVQGNFVIMDGYEGNNSTNGTWFLVEDYVNLGNSRVIKIFNKTIQVNLC